MSPSAQSRTSTSTSFGHQLDQELDAVDWARYCLKSARTEADRGGARIPGDAVPDPSERTRDDVLERAHDRNLVGLAFSGGGIRSATFNLGVIQRLARLKLLHRFDYLSTVSGGGYIGAWLSAWVQREQGAANCGVRPGILGVEERLSKNTDCEGSDGPSLPEPRQVRWLREFSNYLTPRVGALSTDTLTGVATYLRNLILNQSVLIAFGTSLLVLPWFLVALLPHLGDASIRAGIVLAVLLLGIGSLVAGYETLRADLGKRAEGASDKAEAWARGAYWALFGSFAGTALIAGMLVTHEPSAMNWGLSFVFGITYGAGTSIGWWKAARDLRDRVPELDPGTLWFLRPLWALIAGIGLAGMLYLWAWLLRNPMASLDNPLFAVALGPLVMLGAILLTITLHLGLTGRKLREAGRELWSSHGAHQMRAGVLWLVFAFSSLFGPLALVLANKWVAALGGITWVLTTAAGVLAGSGATTGARGGSKIAELAARIAPYVFVAGILLIVSYGVYRVMWWQWSAYDVSPGTALCESAPRKLAYEFDWKQAGGETVGGIYEAGSSSHSCYGEYVKESARFVEGNWLSLIATAVLAFLASLFLSWRVDINVFSFHTFYRNRIERCYMGASNLTRRPHPLTGLDPTDTPKLGDLVLGLREDVSPEVKEQVVRSAPGEGPDAPCPAQRPIPLINTALNLTSARNLAWQERKAASFSFTPMFCGYEIQAPDGQVLSGYRRTEDYVRTEGKWISLGLPITISGAAASPNAGYHTSAATAFLMTVFNVRLGWWLQNPVAGDAWARPGPRMSLFLLLQELFGMTTDRSKYVYLSDGGHFENLGIYELVRRRCRYIIACDAGCDPNFGFEDLGNAVRKCHIDLGIEIDIDPSAIRPDPTSRRSRFHCAVGRIHYETRDKSARPGYLLYLKSSLGSDAPADIVQYAAEHPDFPHETTADQWYSESQFESYRKLGYHIAGSVLGDAIAEQHSSGTCSEADLEEVFTALAERWYPPGAKNSAAFSHHGEGVEAIFERMRNDDDLKFLDQQIYPEWWYLTDDGRMGKPAPNPQMLPPSAAEIRAGFYLCNSLLQLMENVYHDQDLEAQYGHPDNRGWMNLFRHWSWAGMLRVTWAISASTYGARFQRFCRRRLDLEVGEVFCGVPVSVASARVGGALDPEALKDKGGLNFLEADHVSKLVERCFSDRADALSVVQLSLRVISPFEVDDRSTFSFPFAFALIDAAGAEGELLYYRVRDHLREIGLGRKGLAILLDNRLAEKTASLDSTQQQNVSTAIPEANYQILRRLWTSVVVARGERGGGELDRFV